MRIRPVSPSVLVSLAGFVTIFCLGELAVASGQPWLFPSAGPTAIMLFLTPEAAASSPRNTLCGHAIGIVCAWFALWLTGLLDVEPSYAAEIGHDRALAAALALATTGGLMAVLRVVHPPAGATTLIIAMGLITRLQDFVVIELAVALLTAQGWLINRIAGVSYPAWSPRAAGSTESC